MFHEVAYPFRAGQPLRHHLLAAVHRCMAWIVLRAASRSYTSIEPYQETLEKLAPKAEPKLLRIFSNVPFKRSHSAKHLRKRGSHFRIGVFSNFQPEISALLAESLPVLLENPIFDVRLIGPGEDFIRDFGAELPQFRDRISTTGHLNALEIGPHLEACDALLQLYPDGACAARGTLIAALASGVPIVSNTGPMTESIFARRGAIAFSGVDPTAVRHTVERLQSNQEYARRIGEAGRRLYATEFDVEVTVARLCEAAGITEKIAVNQ
jgi:glycosyltransferase involved in cell wall biosynthesis